MSVQGDQDHKHSQEHGEAVYPSLRQERLQAAPAADAAAGADPGPGGHQWHRQVNRAADPGQQAEAEPGQLRQSARVEGHPEALQGLRAAELLHADARGEPGARHQASVRRSHPREGKGQGGRDHREEGRQQEELGPQTRTGT